MNKTILGGVVVLALLLVGCQNRVQSWQEYYAYLHAPEHGLIKERSIGDMKFTLQHWPTEALVQHDKNSGLSTDSLRKLYDNSLTFLLKLEASDQAAQSFDVMTETVSSLEEFKSQAVAMNFDLQTSLYIDVNGRRIKPVLAILENTYGLQQHRLVNIVFAKEALEEAGKLPEKLDVVFADELFGTGKHHFVFQSSDLENLPTLEL